MKLDEILKAMQFSIPAFLAGIAGSMVSVMRYREITFWRGFVLIASGGVAAGYLTEPLITHQGFSINALGAIGFGIGVFFLVILDLLMALIQYISKNPKEFILVIISILPFSKAKKIMDGAEESQPDAFEETEFKDYDQQ